MAELGMDEPPSDSLPLRERPLSKRIKYLLIKIFLIATTSTCVLAGIIIVITGLWLIFDVAAAKDVEVQEGLEGIRNGAGILLLFGVIVIVINATGFFGVVLRKPKLLIAFFILVGVILVFPEFVLIIWLIANRNDVEALTDGVLTRNLHEFVVNNQTNARIFMTNIQSTLGCCGFEGLSDYSTDAHRKTCLRTETTSHLKYYVQGCKYSLARMFMENIVIIGSLEGSHLIISLMAMGAARKLWIKMRRESLEIEQLKSDHAEEAKHEDIDMDEMSYRKEWKNDE